MSYLQFFMSHAMDTLLSFSTYEWSYVKFSGNRLVFETHDLLCSKLAVLFIIPFSWISCATHFKSCVCHLIVFKSCVYGKFLVRSLGSKSGTYSAASRLSLPLYQPLNKLCIILKLRLRFNHFQKVMSGIYGIFFEPRTRNHTGFEPGTCSAAN